MTLKEFSAKGGRIGGRAKSAAKTRAARQNGKLGGRRPKQPLLALAPAGPPAFQPFGHA